MKSSRAARSRRQRRARAVPGLSRGESTAVFASAAPWVWIRTLSAIGLGLSGYLLWSAWGSSPLPGCGPASGCGSVMGSRWAYVFGVPVSLPAVLVYLVLLGGAEACRRAATQAARQRFWWLLLALGGMVAGAALWFVGLQLFAVKAICPFCMAVQSCGLLTGFLILRQGLRGRPWFGLAPLDSDMSRRCISPTLWPVLAGGAGAIMLAVAQLMYQPPGYQVVALSSEAVQSSTQPLSETGGTSPGMADALTEGKLSRRRALRLYGGEFGVDLEAFPLLGRLDAASVMVCLFDYTCDHCRQLHPLLTNAVHGLSNRLAVLFVPVPLDATCNPAVRDSMPAHRAACDYARTGLAVWRADSAQGRVFNEWFFAQQDIPSLEVFREEAIRLVGTNAFTKAWNDRRIRRQIEWSTMLYHTNVLRYRHGALPQLILGTNLVFGALRDEAQLRRLLSAGGVID